MILNFRNFEPPIWKSWRRHCLKAYVSEEQERERLRDQREREELERNIKERDAARTRKLTLRNLAKEEEKEDDIGALRIVLRQEYLKKRVEKKSEELADEIEDEQNMFDSVEVTESERCEFRFKQDLYDLIVQNSMKDDGSEYKMPDAYDLGVNQKKRFAVALQNSRDGESKSKKMNPFAEQEQWEQHQMGKSTLNFGSKNKSMKANRYEYVFEDQIEFINTGVVKGEKIEPDLEKFESLKLKEGLCLQR
ncbi:pre-mRNA-splicing factor ATP-dependent RNA helicase DEAH1-like [Chenopodium quinoa]|uniref:pre-mRNA-splicing factor ATP-dependent RNA helicase DEAH1-like n=1 Tax=Chenopodium quinoa TaxID=63459 RepID=UPI000B780DD6|nr:pre-mRNA-splicing factor ATP-dependent RNA helicase DEAH1-like [Chenopodium quinoa]